MANETTRVLNLTPLRFQMGGAYLDPFQEAEWPSGVIQLWNELGGVMNIAELKGSDFIIQPDLMGMPNFFGGPQPYLGLEVQNDSGRFVYTSRRAVGPTSKLEQGQPIPPRKSLVFDVSPGDVCWFRAVFTDELVGMVRIGSPPMTPDGSQSRTLRLVLTDKFVNGWREYQSRASKEGLQPKSQAGKPAPSFTPRQMIGEKRKSTPEKYDQGFLTVAVVNQDVSKEAFNGRKNRVVRDVEISGMLLRWGGSNDVLRSFYGEDVDDLRSLTIYADRMEVADQLRFPGTNVTIYARELAFTSEISAIDTTPLGNSIHAVSEFLTKDPLDPTNENFPADKDGKPTYKARDGEKGEKGGTIRLFVGEVFDTVGRADAKRFVSRGGKGQAAEAGGLKEYVKEAGYPDVFGASQIVSVDGVKKLLEDRLQGIRRPRRLWPGGGTSPNISQLTDNKVVAVTLITDFADDRGHLPNAEWRPADKPNPAPRPCNGRNAYAGGWPGAGGDGGCIEFHLSSNQDPKALCVVGSGPPGDPTPAVEGGIPPGPTPAFALTLSVVTAGERGGGGRVPRNVPSFDITDVSGKRGQSAPSRQRVSDLATTPKDCEVKLNEAEPGSIELRPTSEASWVHPNVVCAMLKYARTAYRNGFRDEAAAALDPYYALIWPDGEPKSIKGADGKPQSIDGRLRMALVSVAAMRNNLIRNLDYYGNPPGWVPRLNALSNLQVLSAVRETAYETFYFSDKLLRDFNALDDVREISKRTSDALKNELTEAKKNLQTAYDKIPESLRSLVQPQSELEPIKKDIEDLKEQAKRKAFESTKDTVQWQRFYSSAMQILGGIANCLPVGQPFVGLAGSAFEAASQVDWNAEDPLLTARSAIDSFSSDVTELMTKKKKHVAGLLTKTLRKEGAEQADSVTYLTGILEDATKEPEDRAKKIQDDWKNFKSEASSQLAEQISKASTDVAATDKLLVTLNTEIETLKKKARDAKDELKLEESEGKRQKLLKEKAGAEKTIKNLQAEVETLKDEKKKRLTGFADYKSKLAQTQEEAGKLKQESEKQAAARMQKMDELQEQLTNAKRGSETQQKLIKEREKTVTEVMTNLEGLGHGLGLIGNGIVSLATPLTPDDPTWKRLAQQMLQDDPDFRQKGKQLERKMRNALERKRQRVEELFRWQHVASASIATITSTLGTLSELSHQRQSIDQGLNPAVKSYLEETKERARDILGESIYWFVKSYQYEFLADVDDTLYNFDDWTKKLIEMESTQAAMSATAGGSGGPVSKAPAVVILDKNQFKDVGDGVYKAETLKLGGKLLRTRQTRGENVAGDYKSCVIARPPSKLAPDSLNEKQVWMKEMLDRLREKGQVSFNFVSDFEKGSFALDDARIVDVVLTDFEIITKDRNLSLTIQVVHSGQSVIAKRTEEAGREFFAFQSGKADKPIFWRFVYNHAQREGERISPMVSADNLQENVKGLFFAPGEQAKAQFKDYSPGLFSDYRIEIIDLEEKKDKIQSINRLALNVTISQA